MVGCQAVKDPDIVQRIAAEGHQVGNHSYDHADLHSLTSAQAMADLEKMTRCCGSCWGRESTGYGRPTG